MKKIVIIDPDLVSALWEQVDVGMLSEVIFQNEQCIILGEGDEAIESLVRSNADKDTVLLLHSSWMGSVGDVVEKLEQIRVEDEDRFYEWVLLYTGSVGSPGFPLPDWCWFVTDIRQKILDEIDKSGDSTSIPELVDGYINEGS